MALIIIRAPPSGPLITTVSMPAATVGSPYTFTMTAVGGSGVYAWVLLTAADNWGDWLTGQQPLPPGGYPLPGGVVSGTPEQVGVNNLSFQVTDVNNPTHVGTASFSITVNHQ